MRKNYVTQKEIKDALVEFKHQYQNGARLYRACIGLHGGVYIGKHGSGLPQWVMDDEYVFDFTDLVSDFVHGEYNLHDTVFDIYYEIPNSYYRYSSYRKLKILSFYDFDVKLKMMINEYNKYYKVYINLESDHINRSYVVSILEAGVRLNNALYDTIHIVNQEADVLEYSGGMIVEYGKISLEECFKIVKDRIEKFIDRI